MKIPLNIYKLFTGSDIRRSGAKDQPWGLQRILKGYPGSFI